MRGTKVGRKASAVVALAAVGVLALPTLQAGAHNNAGLTAQVCGVTGYVRSVGDDAVSGQAFFQNEPIGVVRNQFTCGGVTQSNGPLVATAKGCLPNPNINGGGCLLGGSSLSSTNAFSNTLLNAAASGTCHGGLDSDNNPETNPEQTVVRAGCGLAGGTFSQPGFTATMADLDTTAGNVWNCNGKVSGQRAGAVVLATFTMNCGGAAGSANQGANTVEFKAHGYAVITFAFDPADLGAGCNLAGGTPCAFIGGPAAFATVCHPAPAQMDPDGGTCV